MKIFCLSRPENFLDLKEKKQKKGKKFFLLHVHVNAYLLINIRENNPPSHLVCTGWEDGGKRKGWSLCHSGSRVG